MRKKTCIVLIGGPCSGKSSIGKMATKELDKARYISSGGIARALAESDNAIKCDLDAGLLAPEGRMREAISCAIWNSFILDDKDIVILDGFPRFGEQAEWLHNLISHRFKIHYVLIDAPLSTLVERSLSRNRSDDKSIESRLKYYYGVTYNDLFKYVNTIINANENTVEECSILLANFIKEVTKC